MTALKIGGVAIPLLAALEIEQSYEPVGGETIFRTDTGVSIKQMTWGKTRITTSGSGWLPAGLAELDTSAQLVLSCVVPRQVPAAFATRQATLPDARRSDAGCVPWGVAILADGSAVRSAVTMADDVATVAAVSGAAAYAVLYFPEYTVWAMRPTESGTPGDAGYAWQLVCEQV